MFFCIVPFLISGVNKRLGENRTMSPMLLCEGLRFFDDSAIRPWDWKE
jgi:hypothetical protein